MIHCYKLGGYNIILDIASGAIHSVDDAAYDAIRVYEGGDMLKSTGAVKNKYPELTDSEISELFDEIETLKFDGKLYSSDSYIGADYLRVKNPRDNNPRVNSSRAKNTAGIPPVKALCMNVSHLCNMKCSYCFAGAGYAGAGELMEFETGKRAVDFLFDASGDRNNLDIDFFGGEPLLNWDVVKSIVKYARRLEQGSGKKFRFTLTTNGLLIDDDVIDFTNREMHNVVLSLDGREHIHDAHRKLMNGAGSYAAVLPKIMKLVQARSNKGYYIRGTYTRDNLDFVSDILHLADLGFMELSMEPVVADRDEPHCLKAEDIPALCEQYEALALEMLRRREEGKGFSFYHFTLDLTGGPCVHKRIAGCGVGTEYLAVTPRGDLYPCHQFIGNEKFLMGDVLRGITNQNLREAFGAGNIYSRAECTSCWARFYCSGGCAANAHRASGSIDGIYELGCELFKKRVECAIMMKVAGSYPSGSGSGGGSGGSSG